MQNEYIYPPKPTTLEDYLPFEGQTSVLTKDYAFYYYSTWELLWDIFEPPQDIIFPQNEIINPKAGNPYWKTSSEVFLRPLSMVID
jgi:hypothetical protein